MRPCVCVCNAACLLHPYPSTHLTQVHICLRNWGQVNGQLTRFDSGQKKKTTAAMPKEKPSGRANIASSANADSSQSVLPPVFASMQVPTGKNVAVDCANSQLAIARGLVHLNAKRYRQAAFQFLKVSAVS